MKLSYLALCLPLCAVGVAGMSCYPLGKGCTEEAKANITCEFGYVTGPCFDCECAKGELESCGGLWGILGKCGENLACATKGGRPESFPEGICVKIGEPLPEEPLTEEPPYPEEPPQNPNVPQLLLEKLRPHSLVHVSYA